MSLSLQDAETDEFIMNTLFPEYQKRIEQNEGNPIVDEIARFTELELRIAVNWKQTGKDSKARRYSKKSAQDRC